MKLRLPALAIVIGISVSVIPMRSLASSATVVLSSTDTVSELIVERLPGRSSLAAMSLIENELDLDASVDSKIANRLEVIELDRPISRAEADALVQQLVNSGKVAFAEINEKRYVATAPNDPDYGSQWYLKDFATPGSLGVGIEAAWDHTVGSTDVVIAVIDTGGTAHPDMTGRLLPGYDFFSNDGDATDPGDASDGSNCAASSSTWHGTKVAGVIGANVNNALGIAGVNQRSLIQHIRILGPCGGDTADEIKAIRWAAGLPVDGVPLNPTPARVINLSLGGSGTCSTIEQQAINAATAVGSIVVVAAGNSSQDLDQYQFAPANCDNVITVAATTMTGARASYSNFGSKITIAAPGSKIVTTTANDLYTPGDDSNSGTSFSAPVVSGIISLMLSVNPVLEYNGILALMNQPGVANPFPSGSCSSNINDTYYCGLGILDAAHAVHAALSIAPEVFSPMQPQRMADTRQIAEVSSENPLILDVRGTFGLPTQGLEAVVLNVTATGATSNGFVTVWPCADTKPLASSVNYTAGEDIPNTVIASPDQYGKICLDSSTPVNLLADLSGWFLSGDGLHTFTPQRAFDTRKTGFVLTPETPYSLQVTGSFALPSSGVSSVVLNVTAAGATASGYITVWPCNQPQPNTSNLNYLPYQDIPNAVIATVDSNGQVCFASSSPTFLIADISGWFAQGTNLNVITPQRLFDTRPAKRVSTSPTYVLDLSTASPISPGAATAVVLNVTAAGATKAGFATVWPCDQPQPPTSNLNFDANEDIPNLVITKVSATNTVCFSASAPVHLLADLFGWFMP